MVPVIMVERGPTLRELVEFQLRTGSTSFIADLLADE